MLAAMRRLLSTLPAAVVLATIFSACSPPPSPKPVPPNKPVAPASEPASSSTPSADVLADAGAAMK
jgi:hypothetical protein